MKQICTTHDFTELKLINHLLFTFYSSIQMNSPFSCYFLDLRISFPELRSRMFYVLRKEIKMFFFKFWGESETVPVKKNRRYKKCNFTCTFYLISLPVKRHLITRLTPGILLPPNKQVFWWDNWIQTGVWHIFINNGWILW